MAYTSTVDIEGFIKNRLAQEGWSMFNLEIRREDTPHFIEGMIDQNTWQIRFVIPPNFEAAQQAIVDHAKLNIANPTEKVLGAIIDHEHGHWKTCPMDMTYQELLLDGVSKGLMSAGFDRDKAVAFAPEVANMFSDIVVNGVMLEDRSYKEGRVAIYTDRAYFNPESSKEFEMKDGKIVKAKPQYTDWFALFVDAQMKLVRGDKAARGLAERYAENFGKLGDTSRQMLGAIIGDDLAKKAFKHRLNDKDIGRVHDILRDETRWHDSAEQFAEIIAPHIKDTESGDMELWLQLGQLFKKLMSDPKYRKEVIRKGIERGATDLGYARRDEVLDEYYRSKASEIVLEFMKKEEDLPTTNLFHMSARKMEDDEPIDSSVNWARTLFVKGEPVLYKKSLPYDVPIQGNSNTGSMEDIAFVIDTSGSMGWEGTPDDSKYHKAILAVYSVIRYLEKSGKAQFMRFGLMQFGTAGRTTWTGWKGYDQLDSLTSQLFTGYQNAPETIIDTPRLTQMESDSRGNFMVMMTSDGEIHNPADALKACTRLIKNHNDFILFQIESNSSFAEGIKKEGAIVVNVQDERDLVGLNLSVASAKYSGAPRPARQPDDAIGQEQDLQSVLKASYAQRQSATGRQDAKRKVR